LICYHIDWIIYKTQQSAVDALCICIWSEFVEAKTNVYYFVKNELSVQSQNIEQLFCKHSCQWTNKFQQLQKKWLYVLNTQYKINKIVHNKFSKWHVTIRIVTHLQKLKYQAVYYCLSLILGVTFQTAVQNYGMHLKKLTLWFRLDSFFLRQMSKVVIFFRSFVLNY
jgi:hypothetical protein